MSRTKGSCFCLATLFVAVSKLLQGGKKESKVTALVVQLMNIVFSDSLNVSLLNNFPLFMYSFFFSCIVFFYPDICKILHFNLSFSPWLIFQGVISSL